MQVLIIPDKFKGSLTAAEVISAIRNGLHQQDPQIKCQSVMASDGGDGFLESVRQCADSVSLMAVPTLDPLGRPMQAEYLFDENAKIAYVEMARASGMELLRPEERNPVLTSTEGTGRLMIHAIDSGAKTIYVGLGGSATNDGGVGIAHAMGFRCLNRNGELIQPTGGQLIDVDSIHSPSDKSLFEGVQIFAINDVQNPLLGETGAAVVYGPQKGADPAMVNDLEKGLDHLQQIVHRDLGIDCAAVAGAGAAGGTGYGLKAFLGADFLSGIEFVLSLTGVETLLAGGKIDAIITGEGRIDDQTGYGKLVRGVAQVGAKYDVPVVALCGALQLKSATIQDLGLERVLQIHDPSQPLEYTMENASRLLTEAAARILVSPAD